MQFRLFSEHFVVPYRLLKSQIRRIYDQSIVAVIGVMWVQAGRLVHLRKGLVTVVDKGDPVNDVLNCMGGGCYQPLPR